MGKIKRKFDVQFKTTVVQAIQSGTHTLKDICQEHQLQRQTVERWIERFSEGQLIERSYLREKLLEKENDKLKSKIGDLVMQIDLLKKFVTGQLLHHEKGGRFAPPLHFLGHSIGCWEPRLPKKDIANKLAANRPIAQIHGDRPENLDHIRWRRG